MGDFQNQSLSLVLCRNPTAQEFAYELIPPTTEFALSGRFVRPNTPQQLARIEDLISRALMMRLAKMHPHHVHIELKADDMEKEVQENVGVVSS
jgi:hypothetical protein